MTNDLVHFDRARQELALAKDIDEVKQIRDKAEALRLYIKQQGASLEMQNHCAEIKLRAERRAGEILREMEKNPGTKGQLQGDLPSGYTMKPPGENISTLSDLGISKVQSHRWQLESDVPEPEFERHVAEVKSKGEELTSKGLLDLAYQRRRIQEKQSVVNVAPPNGKYSTIIASGVPGVGKGEKTMIVQCPHCGMIVHLGRVTGRKPLSITVKNVCDALQAHCTVTAAACQLGCSRGYIYHELAKHGTTPKEVLAGSIHAL